MHLSLLTASNVFLKHMSTDALQNAQDKVIKEPIKS